MLRDTFHTIYHNHIVEMNIHGKIKRLHFKWIVDAVYVQEYSEYILGNPARVIYLRNSPYYKEILSIPKNDVAR